MTVAPFCTICSKSRIYLLFFNWHFQILSETSELLPRDEQQFAFFSEHQCTSLLTHISAAFAVHVWHVGRRGGHYLLTALNSGQPHFLTSFLLCYQVATYYCPACIAGEFNICLNRLRRQLRYISSSIWFQSVPHRSHSIVWRHSLIMFWPVVVRAFTAGQGSRCWAV
jgi:hypothetical protein